MGVMRLEMQRAQGEAMQSPEQVLSFKDCHAQGLCEAGFSALTERRLRGIAAAVRLTPHDSP